jgi:hypothetical protein
MMSDQTGDAETVRIPGQGATSGVVGYRPRHRGALPAPTVIPPAGLLADQRKAMAASARAGRPVRRTDAPVVPHQVRRVYNTPGWLPLTREDAPSDVDQEPVEADDASDGLTRPEGMIRQARWTSPRHTYVATALLLIGFLAAAVASGSGLLRGQSTPTLALTLGCVLGAAGLFAVLVVLRPVVVELSEPWLVVRRNGRHDRFNLASPFLGMRVSGRPGSRKWGLVLDCPDGRTVRVSNAMVDSRKLDVVVTYGRAVATLERVARDERFSR